MRTVPFLLLLAAAAACDQAVSPRIAGLGGATTASGNGTGTGNAGSGTSTGALVISPAQVQLIVGATAQLSTNAPLAQQGNVQWSSSQSAVAAVSPTGLVSAIAPGTAIITARYSFDTTRVATATVQVSRPITTGGSTGTGSGTGTTGGSSGSTGSGNPGAPR